MRLTRPRLGLLVAAALLTGSALAARDAKEDDGAHRFAVIGNNAGRDAGQRAGDGIDARLKQAINEADDKSTAFLVVTGIKGVKEACSDKLYQQRREVISNARRPAIVVPAASDWTECRNSAGRTNAIERLNRIRELFYAEPQSLGARKLPLTRQSASPRFRSYAENAHWSVGKVLYAVLNLPANNNHYLTEAGRNSEYEDRLVANRFWLNRLFAIAKRDKAEAIVLFAEGDLKALSQPTGLRALLRRAVPVPDNDGFAETRRQVLTLAQKFRGKVLLVDSAPLAKGAKPAIEWRGNLGHLSVGQEEIQVTVDPAAKALFRIGELDDAGDKAKGEKPEKQEKPDGGSHPKAVKQALK
ncbi:hypothetical protein ACFQ09_15880 [Massilia norwichensis]|uniref:Uncharacterized protein n=1 Tax=Massilia norwichensis TaxID=1442366 RepID=A0ABT2A6V7_9BURK|nr:hypothetical protein [Massilia norwichensis]MCS0589916.1 hypothetical protein [Massilia norwichensis]